MDTINNPSAVIARYRRDTRDEMNTRTIRAIYPRGGIMVLHLIGSMIETTGRPQLWHQRIKRNGKVVADRKCLLVLMLQILTQ